MGDAAWHGSNMAEEWLDQLKRAAQLQRAGKLDEAERTYEQVLARAPEQPIALHLYGLLLKQRGDLVGAETLLRRAAQQQPEAASMQFALAATYKELGRASEALKHYQAGLTLDGSWHEAWAEQAELLLSLGYLEKACASFERASQLQPPSERALSAWTRCLMELGQDARARALLEPALAQHPSQPALQMQLAQVLERAGEHAASARLLEAVVAADDRKWPALIALARAAQHAGDLARAEALITRALSLAPERYEPLEALALLCSARGNARALESAAREQIVKSSGHSGARALELLARTALGEPALDPALPGLVQRQHLSLTCDAKRGDAVHDELAREIIHHPSLTFSPNSHATVDGYHTGELRVTPSETMSALVTAIEPAVAAYVERLSPAARALVAPRPSRARLNMWAVVLRQRGHQRAHIHPEAWLSGVYYVRVPGDHEPGGQLELGQPPSELQFGCAWSVLTIRPQAGWLVLFPSWLYHRTLPMVGSDERISVAFDVVAC